MIDTDGSLMPGIDGFNTRMNTGIVSLMRQCTAYAVLFPLTPTIGSDHVLKKDSFQKRCDGQKAG